MIEVSEHINSTDILVRNLDRYKGSDGQCFAVAFTAGWFQTEKDSDPRSYSSADVYEIFKKLYQIGQKNAPTADQSNVGAQENNICGLYHRR